MLNRVFYLFIVLIIISGCANNSDKSSEKDKKEEVSLNGNYVTDDYLKRNEGYDWVSVIVNELTDSMIHISVRSRADIKKPACTFDAKAIKQNSAGTYKAIDDGNSILFLFAGDSLVIRDDSESSYSNLNYYCSGGGSIAGVYQKIAEPLDSTQIDKVIFRSALNYDNFSFFVEVYGNKLTIQPIGLSVDNQTVEHEIEGTVMNAEIGDLNTDGFPEVLVYVQSVGSGSYGSIIGYSVNNGKSMSQVYLPEITENQAANAGYMGHDEFAIVENTFVRRFPIYKPGDVNAKPSGGLRQIQYKLKEGEALRQLVVDRIVEY